MSIIITTESISFDGQLFKKGDVTASKEFEAKRKSDDGIPLKRLRAFEGASTFIDLNSKAGRSKTAGSAIDIFVKDTYEAFHVDPSLVSIGPVPGVPLQLTGSIAIGTSYSDPHEFKGKYQFIGNPDNYGSAGEGVEIKNDIGFDYSGSKGGAGKIKYKKPLDGILQPDPHGGVSFTDGNVIMENTTISQASVISQSMTIGISPVNPDAWLPCIVNLIGVGNDCHIKIADEVIVKVGNNSTLKIQCPQPDVTVNTDIDTITLSNGAGDETVISTGEFGTNPQYITTNYSVPAGNVAVWYGPIYIGTTPEGLVPNIGSLRLNENTQIKIQAF